MIHDLPTRGSIFGSLDQVASHLEMANKNLNTNLESKVVRFRTEDMVRMKKYIKRIKSQLREIDPVIKEFATLAK